MRLCLPFQLASVMRTLTGIVAGLLLLQGTLAAAPQRRVVTQLPGGVEPRHYSLRLQPDAVNLRFTAEVEIELVLHKPTRTLTLHALDLDFDRAGIDRFGDARVTLNKAAQTASFTFGRNLPAGRHTLALAYRGKIYQQASGLFALDFETGQGPRRALFTQFEAADARRFLPSWDEPSYKATFDLCATVPAAQRAVSNMPVASETPQGEESKTVCFQRTPRMSTYLLSFNLGELERRSEQNGATELGIVTRNGESAKADFALEAARQSLNWYNDYFGIAFPLPKLDHIAAPGQSQFFGAMENWGAILYFEQAMLLDPGFSTQHDQHRVFANVAHETAHQWFGNLVTMAWWDDLWLNEGFASWMTGRAAEKFHPEWNANLDAIDARESAMLEDALATSHAVVQKVASVQQAAQAFDGITYSKGEAVLRMLEAHVGEAAWRNGVRAYLRQHAYGNAVTQDLWRAVEAAAGKPVRAIAHDFTRQPGVPLITLGKRECVKGSTQLELKQSEFAPDRPGKTARRWQVPVATRVLGSAVTVKTVIKNGSARLTLPGCGAVLLNAGQQGYFRTLYGSPALQELSAAFAQLDAIDQLGILSDNWALGLGSRASPTDALKLIEALPIDAQPQVWSAVLDILQEVDRLYRGQADEQARWRTHAIKRLTPLLARLGWLPQEGEADASAILRNKLIAALGSFNDGAVLAQAQQRLADGTNAPAALPASLRRTVLGVVAQHADAASWAQLRAQANAETSPMQRTYLFELLGTARDPALAQQALSLALTPEPGETTGASILRRVAFEHPELAWEFAQQNLKAVLDKLPESDRPGFVPALGSESTDRSMMDKIRQYARTHIASDAQRNANESIGAIRERIRMRATRLPLITAWLDQHALPPLRR